MFLERTQQLTLDHKSGFHYVTLAPESWERFVLGWIGLYYAWVVLCFEWCASPYIYHSPNNTVAKYLQSQTIPISMWLDDLDVELPGHARPQPDRPTEGSP